MGKKVLWALFILLLFSHPALSVDLSLFVSDEDLSFQAQQQIYSYSGNPLFVAGEIFYSTHHDQDSWLFDTHLSVENFYQKVVNLGLGFEALLGNVQSGQNEDGNIFAVGFRLSGKVDLDKVAPKTSKFPLSAEISLFYSPPILSFADTERVFRGNLGLYFFFNPNAAVGVRYEIIDVDLDNAGDHSWDNSTLLFGAKIAF